MSRLLEAGGAAHFESPAPSPLAQRRRRVVPVYARIYKAVAGAGMSQSDARASVAPRARPENELLSCPGEPRRRSPALHRHGLFHFGDELLERERLGEKIELLPVGGQMLLERILGVAGHENDLQLRVALAQFAQQRRAVHFR